MVAPVPATVRDAFAACERLARTHYENFPVASRLLPPDMRPHVAAVYAFARVADDLADEGTAAPDERLAALDRWRHRLWAAAAGDQDPEQDRHTPVFVALRHSIEACSLPVQLLDDLLSAFAQDVTVSRYATWTEVLEYCRRSANPVGRLVLRIAGHRDAALDESSDALCTALQLTNFWQDLESDWHRGRLYVPLADAAAFGAALDEFDPARLSPEWRCTLERVADRTRALFRNGRYVCDGVRGRLRLELRMTWLAGTTILDRVVASGFDVHHARPTIRAADAPGLLWRAVWWTTDAGPTIATS